jgi:hypothetical protein
MRLAFPRFGGVEPPFPFIAWASRSRLSCNEGAWETKVWIVDIFERDLGPGEPLRRLDVPFWQVKCLSGRDCFSGAVPDTTLTPRLG